METIITALAGLGGLSGLAAVLLSRRKIASEAKVSEAEATDKYNAVILRQLAYLGQEIEGMQEHGEAVEEQLKQYRQEAEKAYNREANLRMQVGKLRKRLMALEDYIRDSGLIIPPEDESLYEFDTTMAEDTHRLVQKIDHTVNAREEGDSTISEDIKDLHEDIIVNGKEEK